jgi:hypothetical protein
MQDQVVCGERVIVALVRESGVVVAGGACAGVDPVALLVWEYGKWFFVGIEEGFGQRQIRELLEKEAEDSRATDALMPEKKNPCPGE